MVKKKRGGRGQALKVLDENRRVQLGYLQRELVPVLWPLTDKVELVLHYKIEIIKSIQFDWFGSVRLVRLSSIGSIEFGNRTHPKVPVRLCSIAEPIAKQSNDWVRLIFGSDSFD